MSALALLPLLALLGCPTEPEKPIVDTGDPIDEDGDGWSVGAGDCQDGIASVHPEAEEVPCDGIDNDCDGLQFDDADGDGHECRAMGGDDCDDTNAEIYPGHDDVCGDDVDSNCDSEEECDCDEDGYSVGSCGGEDCNDMDAAIHPGADDACYDGIDAGCNGDTFEYDCDLDSYVSAAYGGDDCYDEDPLIHPDAGETCLDGIDNDCDEATPDCDCDGDGYDATDCGGADCDDANPDVNPDAADVSVNGLDDNCDGVVDEDAYCNLYAPLSNGTSARRIYAMTRGTSAYEETVTLADWDAAAGTATVGRSLLDALGLTQTIDEDWTCDASGVSMDGWAYGYGGMPSATIRYDSPRLFLLPEASMTTGATWSYAYTASDATYGNLWSAEGAYTVEGTEEVTVAAGTFTALVITNVYTTTDLSGMGQYDSAGHVTMYYVEKLGLVKSVDVDRLGREQEARELTSYTGFYPSAL